MEEKPRNTGTPPEYAAPRPDNFAKINPDRKDQRGPAGNSPERDDANAKGAPKGGGSIPKDTQRIEPAKPPELAHPEDNTGSVSPGKPTKD